MTNFQCQIEMPDVNINIAQLLGGGWRKDTFEVTALPRPSSFYAYDIYICSHSHSLLIVESLMLMLFHIVGLTQMFFSTFPQFASFMYDLVYYVQSNMFLIICKFN